MIQILKKICFGLALATTSMAAHAQFEAGTKYIATGLSGLNMSYGDQAGFQLGLDASAGYFIADSWLVKANLNYNHTRHTDDFSAGIGGRYYIRQNGLFLGAGIGFSHLTKNINDIEIPIEAGYCYYLNGHVSIEPSVYYNMSINDFASGSKVGLRLGLGFYF